MGYRNIDKKNIKTTGEIFQAKPEPFPSHKELIYQNENVIFNSLKLTYNVM